MEKLISVIVPVYNCEKTLGITIESIINQTYKNLEIILVDDGSKDNSGSICDEYAKLDSRINVIHQSNKGLSGARNTGIHNSNGFYLSFVDAGDYVESNTYEKLLPYINSDIDYIDFPYYVKAADGNRYSFSNNYDKNKIFDKKFIVDEMIPLILNLKENKKQLVLNFVWRLLFKKSIVDEYDVYFDEKIRKWEDRDYILSYIIHCESVVFLEDPLYTYVCDIDNNMLSKSYYPNLLSERIRKLNEREIYFKEKYDFENKFYIELILGVFLDRFFELIDHEEETTVKEYIRDFFKDDFVKSIFDRAENVIDDKRLLKYLDCYDKVDEFYVCLLKDKKSVNKLKFKDKIVQFASKVKHKFSR